MAKKNLKKFNLLLCCSMLLTLAAFCMMFLPMVQYKVSDNDPTLFKGMDVVFGYTAKKNFQFIVSFTTETKIFDFSFLNLLPFIFMVCSLVILALGVTQKKPKLQVFLSTLLNAGAIVFLVFLVKNTQISKVVLASISTDVIDRQYLSLAYGTYIAFVLLGLSCLVNVYKLLK